MAQRTDYRSRWKWPDVEAQLDGQVAVDERLEPTRGNRARIGGDRQHTRVLAIEPQVVWSDFPAGRRNQVGQCARAEFE